MTTTIKVGQGVTVQRYSDRQACTVVQVSSSGKTFWAREDHCRLLNGVNSGEIDALQFEPGGFSGHTSGAQRWETTPNPQGTLIRVSLRKDGRWKVAKENALVSIQWPYRDFNF